MTVQHVIAVNGVRLHAEERGAGAPVALLHGFTGSGRDLDALAEALAARHRVLAIDLVGHGRSEAPRRAGPYAMERCIAQVAGALEALGAAPVHLFGYSMGGRVALGVAVRRPEVVRSLALLGASAGLESADARARRRHSDAALAARIERDGVAAFVAAWSEQPLFATQRATLPPTAREALRRRRLANRAHGLANALRGMGTGVQPSFHADLADLDVPVWLGHGADDSKFAATARDLATRLPRAERFAVPSAGHAAHLENPDAVARAVLDFLARADPRPQPVPARDPSDPSDPSKRGPDAAPQPRGDLR